LSREDGRALSVLLAPAGVRESAIAALHRRSGVERRGVAILDERGEQSLYEADPAQRGPTTGERLERFTESAAPLAIRAARGALEEAGVEARAVTHLVTVSCTGFEAPGVDQRVIARLGLSADVRRTNVGFMGCHGAINGLAVAAAQAREAGAVALVVCVELCSLHHHYSDRSDQLVANALFADGAAAAVVGVDGADSPSLAAFSSRIFPDSADVMGWRVGDHGFEMTLSPRTPELLRARAPEWIEETLAAQGLSRADVGGWAIHPGGPRIVRAVAEGLGLDESAVEPSLGVLREHGNMSSPTVLFVLKRLMEGGAPRPYVAAAFGPGLAGELMLVR
jgi:predicted naringenin-chalcone synthase